MCNREKVVFLQKGNQKDRRKTDRRHRSNCSLDSEIYWPLVSEQKGKNTKDRKEKEREAN